MSNKLRKHAHVLKFLSKAKPSTANAVIKAGDKALIDTLCECCLNVLNGVVPLTNHQRKKLGKYKNQLRLLKNKSVSRQKKKTLLQKGGFIGALLPPIIGILGGLLGK